VSIVQGKWGIFWVIQKGTRQTSYGVIYWGKISSVNPGRSFPADNNFENVLLGHGSSSF
jgi:hypothetical protein